MRYVLRSIVCVLPHRHIQKHEFYFETTLFALRKVLYYRFETTIIAFQNRLFLNYRKTVKSDLIDLKSKGSWTILLPVIGNKNINYIDKKYYKFDLKLKACAKFIWSIWKCTAWCVLACHISGYWLKCQLLAYIPSIIIAIIFDYRTEWSYRTITKVIAFSFTLAQYSNNQRLLDRYSIFWMRRIPRTVSHTNTFKRAILLFI